MKLLIYFPYMGSGYTVLISCPHFSPRIVMGYVPAPSKFVRLYNLI